MLFEGTMGETLLGGWSVEEKILGRLPATVQLGVMAILIGLLIGLPVGIYSAMRRNTAADYVGRSVAIIGLATPNFWLATLILTFPAIWWAWAPPLRFVPFRDDPLGSLGVFIVPSLILGTYLAAATMRMTRVSSQPKMPNRAKQCCQDAPGTDDRVAPETGAARSAARAAGRGQSKRSSVTMLEEPMILVSLAAACRMER